MQTRKLWCDSIFLNDAPDSNPSRRMARENPRLLLSPLNVVNIDLGGVAGRVFVRGVLRVKTLLRRIKKRVVF